MRLKIGILMNDAKRKIRIILRAMTRRRMLRCLICSAFAVAVLEVISEISGNWLAASAKSGLLVFSLYQALLVSLILSIPIVVAIHQLGDLFEPGCTLPELCRVDRQFSLALEATKKELQNGAGSEARISNVAQSTLEDENLYRAIRKLRMHDARQLFVAYVAVNLGLAVAIRIACSYFGDDAAFSGLRASEGLLKYAYFSTVTLLTVGYGDIVPKNNYGYFCVCIIGSISILLLMLQIGFVVSHWFYLLAQAKADISNFLPKQRPTFP